MPQKSLNKLMLEIILFVTLVALTGHVTVNVWERYVVQKELSSMKSSLINLKFTVNNIGDAYDDLQNELIELARINSKPSIPSDQHYCKKTRAQDEKFLRNLQILLMNVVNESHVKRNCVDKNIECVHITRDKNASTLTRYPLKTAAVGSEPKSIIKKEYSSKSDINNPTSNYNKHKCYKDCDKCNSSNIFNCLKV